MAITNQQLNAAVTQGLSNVIRTWASDQKDALDHANKSVMPVLSSTPTIFKAAAWLNFGLNGTEKLFPASALAEGLKKVSVPIAVANYAVDGFKAIYESEVKKTNALLTKEYSSIRDNFKNTVNQSASDFINTPFAVSTSQVLSGVFSSRLNDFADSAMAISHCENVIRASGIIETDVTKIKERTKEGFGSVCKKIYDIYQGTRYAWGHNVLVRLDPSRTFCAMWGDKPISVYNPLTNKNQHCGPYSYLVGMGAGLDQDEFQWILANAWRLDVKFIDNWSGDDKTYVWPSKNPQTITQIAETFKKKGVTDYAADIQAADAEQWPRTLSVRKG